MQSYDPESPTPTDWLQTDEAERIELVAGYHRHGKITLPNPQLHSVVHVVIENQIALGEQMVIDTLGHLQSEGLSRPPYRRYLERLRRLTAESWRSRSST